MTEASRVMLRPLTIDDIDETYLAWFRDSEVVAYLDAHDITREDAIEHLEAGAVGRSYTVYAIIDLASGAHIGNLKLGPINWKHRYSDCVTVVGRREFWGQGLATEAIRLAIRIAFEDLDLRKLSAGIVEGNAGSLRAYTRAGWTIEGRLVGQYLMNGEARDRIAIACFNPAYFPASIEGIDR